LVPILNHFNAFHIAPSYFFKIHFNIILHLHLGLSSGLFSSGSPTKFLYALLPIACYMSCTSHTPWRDLTILIIFSEESKYAQADERFRNVLVSAVTPGMSGRLCALLACNSPEGCEGGVATNPRNKDN
jgi:hypothetical protein